MRDDTPQPEWVVHHVLLIDPSESRDVLAERLRLQGYTVTATGSAVDGALAALSEPPAVVVADLWMSAISGVQLCRLLRSEPATEAVPVILRGPGQAGRDRFWAEHAGASGYVARGRMGDLVRAIAAAIAAHPPQDDAFFVQLSGGELDLRDRIAAHLDAALFESVIASEVRALATCGTFERLFDVLSQFVVQVASYRWLAVYTSRPERVGLHMRAGSRDRVEPEALAALGLSDDVPVIRVEDEDALGDLRGPPPLIETIRLGDTILGRVALASGHPAQEQDAELLRIIARELSGPVKIATLVEESQRLAMMDPLTGLLNRRAFVSAAQRELARLERYGEPLCILLLDVDHFKAINDQRGHATGDAVLAALGRMLLGRVRTADVVGRWGGEEFVVALTGSPEAGAVLRAEAIREAIRALVVVDGQRAPVPITASIGVAAARPGESLDSLIDRADRAMYAAKSGGRDRVVLASPDAPKPAAGEPVPALVDVPNRTPHV